MKKKLVFLSSFILGIVVFFPLVDLIFGYWNLVYQVYIR